MAIIFEYNNPDTSAAPGKQIGYRALTLRLDPTEVSWTYNVNTQSFDTYGGQVIQVLSINIDTLSIHGQLGREGAFGVYKVGGAQKDDRYGGPVPAGGWSNKYVDRQFDYNGVDYPGLHAMVEFFREYFALVTQGGDPQNPGRFVQVPMKLRYGGGPSDQDRAWTITPTSFPDFRRANEAFAPEWRVEAQVIESDATVKANQKNSAIARLQDAIGYKAANPFSDPLADPSSDLVSINDQIVSRFKAILPKFSKGELEDMVWRDISVPSTEWSPGTTVTDISNIMQGEVGTTATKTKTDTANQSAGGHGAV